MSIMNEYTEKSSKKNDDAHVVLAGVFWSCFLIYACGYGY